MVDRGFSEVDLRAMLEEATGYRPDEEEGRWSIEATHGELPWEVIVEPDTTAARLVIITAYPVGL